VYLPIQVRSISCEHDFIINSTLRLLGWSAFAGFVVLIVGWPLNSFLIKRSVRIQKGSSTARDKRMGVVNELIGSVSHILFVLFICHTCFLIACYIV
jgi:Trk-type K+ transport system membrane component